MITHPCQRILGLLGLILLTNWLSNPVFAIEPRQAKTRFVQKQFAIGACWFKLPDDDKADAFYADVAAAHFNVAMGPHGSINTVESAVKQLKLCEKHQIKAIVYCRGIPADKLPVSTACLGYNLWDEPNADLFPKLRKRVDEIRIAQPGMLSHINLYPNYANKKQLGTDTYEEHVSRFVKEVDADLLSMDHYPIFKPSHDSRDRYCRNLETMRIHALKRGIPFWNYFNTMPFGPHTDPTEAQIRWQVFTSLAYGAKGVCYFTYLTPLTPEFPKGGALISRDGRRTRHYQQAQRINRRLVNLGPAIMQLTSTRMLRVTGEGTAADLLAGSPLRSLQRNPVDPPHNYLLGVFRHRDGRRAVMLNNYHFAYTAWPTVVFDAPLQKVREISQQNGQEIPVADDSPDMEGLQISLDSGEGRLFLLP